MRTEEYNSPVLIAGSDLGKQPLLSHVLHLTCLSSLNLSCVTLHEQVKPPSSPLCVSMHDLASMAALIVAEAYDIEMPCPHS